MDVEARVLLYMVVFGTAVGLFVIVRRRAWTFWAHILVLAGLLAATGAVLALPRRAPAWSADALFGAFCLLVLAPSLLLMSARAAGRARRFRLASVLATLAATLLGGPRPIRGERLYYAAFAATEAGDEAGCARRLQRLAASGAIPAESGGPILARVLPPAGARRWGDVLAAIDADPGPGNKVAVLEAVAAAETGDFRRAVAACETLARQVHPDAIPLAQARRAVLAAAGRHAFLEEAAQARLPVMARGVGNVDLVLARALEGAGRVDDAATAYTSLQRHARGAARRDAQAGEARCTGGAARIAELDTASAERLERLEHICRAQPAAAPHVPWYRAAVATVIVCLLTVLVSVLSWTLAGTDILSLLSVGALSAPLIEEHGDWWRLATTMGLHVGVVHLVTNIGSILVIGVPLERRIGVARWLTVYLASGWVGSLASVYVMGTEVGVGASGAAMGVMGAFFAIVLLRAEWFTPVERKRWTSLLWLTVVATAVLGGIEYESFDNAAHGGGFVAGFLCMVALLPSGAGRVRASWVPVAAAGLLVVAQVAATAAALVDGPRWGEFAERRGGGAVVRLPVWFDSTTSPTRGLFGQSQVLQVSFQAGAFPHAIADPAGLAGSPELQALLSGEPSRVITSEIGDLSQEDLRFDLPDGGASSGYRLVQMRRGRAFAVVGMDADPHLMQVLEPLLAELRASLQAED